ncbi:MAG: hypothetical protein IJH20_03685 [Bacilli bacterium]|nr:hypothetical protein [Bacilli bacterium]
MKKKNKKNISRLVKFQRKFTIIGAIALFAIWGISFFAKNSLSSLNIEVERLSRNVKEQKETNQSLTMKINELASLENINTVASKSGLAYNNDNIRIVNER